MTSRPLPSAALVHEEESVCVVRWVLQTGRAAIACEVGMNPDRSFQLRVVPSWRPGATLVERFDSAVPAIKRHAQLASQLRDLGWMVTDRSTAWPTAAFFSTE